MPSPNFTERLDSAVAEYALLTHPFYQAWNAGTLSLEALQEYAKQYYQFERAFPTYVSQVHANTSDSFTRKQLLENLLEEERGEVNHPELWLRFSDSLGLERAEVRSAELLPETAALLETMRNLTRNGDTLEGLSALYGYESQIPEVSATKIEGLVKHYDISDERSLSFFRTHEAADKLHRQGELDCIALYAHTASDEDRAIAAAQASAKAMYGMLTGITEKYEVMCEA
jgi:pyrroloquinoline-quinone synthase